MHLADVAKERLHQRWIRGLGVAGLLAFAIGNIVILGLVLADPEGHSVVGIYRAGSLGWWAGQDIFGSGQAGFIYLPSFAVLYTPFAVLGAPWGDMAWRAVSAAAFAFAIWEALRVAAPRFGSGDRLLLLGIALLITIPGAANALRNGQASTILYALMLWGTVALIEKRLWLAAILLALAFALKPLAIVYLLLVVVVRPQLIGRLLVALAVLLLLPLLSFDPLHALELYRLGVVKVLLAGAPHGGRWSDLSGILVRLGAAPHESALMLLRLVAAFATLALGIVAVRRGDAVSGLMNLLALAVVYLMLMSPRTEAQTYIMLAGTLAISSTLYWHVEHRRGTALVLAGLAIALGLPGISRSTLAALDLWLDPAIGIAYLPLLIRECLRAQPFVAMQDAASTA